MRKDMEAREPGVVPDATLVDRTCAGDESAFATLFDRHERLIRARVRRVLSPAVQRKVAISDIVQETRIAAFQACPAFDARHVRSVRAWLVRIAELKALEAVRRYVGVAKRDIGREDAHGARPDTEQFVGRGPSPSEAAIASELESEVRRAMARLPHDYREVLRLVGVKGLTFVAAAERLDRSAEAVRKLYGRALLQFSSALSAERRARSDE